MEDLNTKKLIKFYRKTNSKKALDVLVKNHQLLLHKAIQGIPKNLIDYDSQISIANTVLLNCINVDFDVNNKIKFTTYLMKIIRFRILDEIRKIKINFGYEPEQLEHNEKDNFLLNIENTEIINLMLDQFPKLPRTEQIILGCKLQGMNNNFIAESCGVTESLISQHYKSAINNLKMLLVRTDIRSGTIY
ncbi:MAG: sigma-70 family RNA polymerase sigma factor [Ignavibacteriae bacterium]|nr:sigma-70 family RNA polymerase sigma factor [Ignavibacteriota bacterium]